MKTVNLRAGTSSTGQPVFEEVLVTPLGGSRHRLLRSPGLVQGVARDDEIQHDADTGSFELVKRGGRVTVQLYVGSASQVAIERLAAQLEKTVDATWDGLSKKQAVLSFPAAAGFAPAEALLNEFVKAWPGAEWYYGNVYAEDGTSPLNWWLGC